MSPVTPLRPAARIVSKAAVPVRNESAASRGPSAKQARIDRRADDPGGTGRSFSNPKPSPCRRQSARNLRTTLSGAKSVGVLLPRDDLAWISPGEFHERHALGKTAVREIFWLDPLAHH